MAKSNRLMLFEWPASCDPKIQNLVWQLCNQAEVLRATQC